MAIIGKETFKNWFIHCREYAWFLDSLEHLELLNRWVNIENKFETFIELEAKDEKRNEKVSSSAFELLDIYKKLKDKSIRADGLNKFQIKFLKYLSNLFEKNDEEDNPVLFQSFEGTSITDGKIFGNKAKEFYKMKTIIEDKGINCKDLTSYVFNEALEKTGNYINDIKNKYLFEPAFIFEDNGMFLKTRVDILVNKGNKHVEIHEVKATTSIKKEHKFDVMYQYYVLTKCGYIVDDIKIITLNGDYMASEIEFFNFKAEKELVKEKYLNQNIEYSEVEKWFKSRPKIEQHNNNDIKINYNELISISSYEKENKTILQWVLEFDSDYNLEEVFCEINFTLDMPPEKAFNFFKSFNCKKYELSKYKEKEFCRYIFPWFDRNEKHIYLNSNVFRLKDDFFKYIRETNSSVYIKDHNSDNFINEVNKIKLQVNKSATLLGEDKQFIYELAYKNSLNKKIDESEYIFSKKKDVILKVLKDYYNFPVYMYDFESSMWAVPQIINTNPYMQVVFQYSIHTLLDENYDYNYPEKINHKEFIATNKIFDPRIDLINNLIDDLFEFGPGVYVAYYKSFEKSRLLELATIYPEYLIPLMYIHNNTIDLRDFFALAQNNHLIYHPDFNRSSSIKITQPVLEPKFNYSDLVVQKGTMASELFRRYIDGEFSEKEWEEQFVPSMLEYCGRDTMAMVVILQRVIEIIKNYNKDWILTAKGGE